LRTIPHPPLEEIDLVVVLHALSDPVRLEVLRTLANGRELPCGAFHGKVSKSTLSHHLKVLRDAGVTHTRVEGTQRMLSLRVEELEQRFPGLVASVLAWQQAA
jgi:DNA-binding transcriptional ArsR family regulator